MLYTHTMVLIGIIGVSLASEGGWIPKCHHEKIADSNWDLEVQLKSDDSAIRFQMKNPRSMQFVSEAFGRDQLTKAGISTQMPIKDVREELDQICKDSQVWIEQKLGEDSFSLLFSKFEANDVPDTQLEFPVRAHKMDEEQLRALYSESLRQIELKNEHIQSLSENVKSMRETINIAGKKFDEKNQELRELRIQLALKDDECDTFEQQISELKESQRREIVADQIHGVEQSEWQSRSDIVNEEQIERYALEEEFIHLVIDQKQKKEEALNRQVVSLDESNERLHLEIEEEHQRGDIVTASSHHPKKRNFDLQKIDPKAFAFVEYAKSLIKMSDHWHTAGITEPFLSGTHSVKIKVVQSNDNWIMIGVIPVNQFNGKNWFSSGNGMAYYCNNGRLYPGHIPFGPISNVNDKIEVRVHMDEVDPSQSTITFFQNGQQMGMKLMSDFIHWEGPLMFTVALFHQNDQVQIVD